MKNLVLISYLFPPDIGPGPLRATRFLQAFESLDEPQLSLTVVAGTPTRFLGFPQEDQPLSTLVRSRANIVRVRVPRLGPGFFAQAVSYAVFFFRVLVLPDLRKADVVVVSSSRLFTAVLGAVAKKLFQVRFHLDIRDLFSEAFVDLFPGKKFRLLSAIFSRLEAFAVGAADRITVLSPGFLAPVSALAQSNNIAVAMHGVENLKNVVRRPARRTRIFSVVYAGNLGEAQELDRFLPQVAGSLRNEVAFVVAGGGSRQANLCSRLKDFPESSVKMLGQVSRTDVLKLYADADALLLAIKDTPSMRRVIPSKLFEYCMTDLPILAGISGASRDFAEENIPGVFFFDPTDEESLRRAVFEAKSDNSIIDRSVFRANFDAGLQTRQMLSYVLSAFDDLPRESREPK